MPNIQLKEEKYKGSGVYTIVLEKKEIAVKCFK